MTSNDSQQHPAEENFIFALADVSVSFADRDVLDGISLSIGAHDRIAIVGDNGSGKSTLLNVLAGSIKVERGSRTVKVPGGIAYAAQAPQFEASKSVQQVIDSYHQRFRQLEKLQETISDLLGTAQEEQQELLLAQLQQVTDLYEAADGYTLQQRLDTALEQLGMGDLDRSAAAQSLSGGLRSRLALACVLCSGSQVLLLDEPTNDLDETAMSWLESVLAKHQGALIVVSHDRAFLQAFAKNILLVEDQSITSYSDGYRGFIKAKEQERLAMIAAHEQWKLELERAEYLVEKNASKVAAIPRKQEMAAFGHGAFRQRSANHGSTSKVRQAKSRVADLTENEAPAPPQRLEFKLPTQEEEKAHRSILLGASRFSRTQAPRLKGELPVLQVGDRWLITGPNGAGKTSLLKAIAGELRLESGAIESNENLRIGWLRQEAGDLRGATVVQAYSLALGIYVEDAVEQLLQLGLFEREDLLASPNELSAGQRRRLELAIAVGAEIDILLLDEPTNHLAPQLVEQLENALKEFPGAVIAVSHDRRFKENFMERTRGRLIKVEDGEVSAS